MWPVTGYKATLKQDREWDDGLRVPAGELTRLITTGHASTHPHLQYM